MEFRCGRSNLALTVFVPYDCKNSCRFCTTKKSYEEKPANLAAVAYRLCVQMISLLQSVKLSVISTIIQKW